MTKRREINIFSISFLDLLSGALGAVIILYIAVPKAKDKIKIKEANTTYTKTNDQKNKYDPKSQYDKSTEDKKKVNELLKRIKEVEQVNNSLKLENEKLEKKISATNSKENSSKEESLKPIDVGFKFKGKNIVFIIDVSGSMHHEDRIGQVKAGLKMLITSMSSEFNIEVIHFPNGPNSDYNYLWGRMQRMDQYHKEQVYQFLHLLRPHGFTPTRVVLEYALSRYDTASDIVLLSDGAPTKSRSMAKDDINGIIRMVSEMNINNIQINAIGVGSNFLSNKRNAKYQFLENLTSNHNGFFVGF